MKSCIAALFFLGSFAAGNAVHRTVHSHAQPSQAIHTMAPRAGGPAICQDACARAMFGVVENHVDSDKDRAATALYRMLCEQLYYKTVFPMSRIFQDNMGLPLPTTFTLSQTPSRPLEWLAPAACTSQFDYWYRDSTERVLSSVCACAGFTPTEAFTARRTMTLDKNGAYCTWWRSDSYCPPEEDEDTEELDRDPEEPDWDSDNDLAVAKRSTPKDLTWFKIRANFRDGTPSSWLNSVEMVSEFEIDGPEMRDFEHATFYRIDSGNHLTVVDLRILNDSALWGNETALQRFDLTLYGFEVPMLVSTRFAGPDATEDDDVYDPAAGATAELQVVVEKQKKGKLLLKFKQSPATKEKGLEWAWGGGFLFLVTQEWKRDFLKGKLPSPTDPRYKEFKLIDLEVMPVEL